VSRVVDAVFVQDERIGQRADLKQSVPVHRVSRQPGYLESEHDAGASQADLRHQTLKAFAVSGRSA